MEWKGIQISYNPLPQISLSSESVITNHTNASVSAAIPQGTACSTNSSGMIIPLDVSNPTNYNAFVGYANVRIPASATGPVISNGRLLNFTTALAAGTPLYIGVNGAPTNIVPSVGVNGFQSGYAVFFLGVLVQNQTNDLDIDIALFTQLVGTL